MDGIHFYLRVFKKPQKYNYLAENMSKSYEHEKIYKSKNFLKILSVAFSILGVVALYDKTEIIDRAFSWQFSSEFIFATLLIFLSIITLYFCYKGEEIPREKEVYHKPKINYRINLIVFFIITSISTILWLLSIHEYSHALFLAWIAVI